MRLSMIKCDVKTCGKLLEASEGKSLVFAGKLYDFCPGCFEEIDKWIQATLNEGQVKQEDKPKPASIPIQDDEFYKPLPYYPPQPIQWPHSSPWRVKTGEITWTADANGPITAEYTVNASAADLDVFDKWLNSSIKKD